MIMPVTVTTARLPWAPSAKSKVDMTALCEDSFMRILVIGGTQFVGKHFVEEAVRRGHDVVLFNRGSKPAPAGVERVITGDRNTDLARLGDGQWDAVVDTSAYFPRQVREAASFLEAKVERYLFISTISVYADQTAPNQDEGGGLSRLDDESADEVTGEVTGETYGPLKVAAEEALAAVYPADRSLVVRPGIIVGPDDPTDRFTYWPIRVPEGGEVLAPGGPDLPMQWIDARDLARWLVASLEDELAGTFNAVSEAGRFTLGQVLDASLEASGSNAQITWVDEEFLLEQGVQPFADLPLWLPDPMANMWTVDASKARASGLRIGPVAETVEATLAWQQARGAPDLKFGMSAEREAAVLKAWRARGD